MYTSICLADIAQQSTLNTEQLAKMCGVSRRQLSYWVERGIISDTDGDVLNTMEKVLLIKGELDTGANLRQAVRRAERRLEERDLLLAGESSPSSEKATEVLVSRLEEMERSLLRIKTELPQLTASVLLCILDELDGIALDTTANNPAMPMSTQSSELGRSQYLLQRLGDRLLRLDGRG